MNIKPEGTPLVNISDHNNEWNNRVLEMVRKERETYRANRTFPVKKKKGFFRRAWEAILEEVW